MLSNQIWVQLLSKAIVIFCCLPAHECAHSLIASKLGDHTGEYAGRNSLNPFRHLDLWGTIMLLAFGVGYAKPVPVNSYNFRKPKRDMALTALAGPGANLAMAIIFLGTDYLLRWSVGLFGDYGEMVSRPSYIFRDAAYINLALTVVNMIPVPPLDGYRVLAVVVPNRINYAIARIERYLLYVLVGLLLFFTVIGFSPISSAAGSLFGTIDGLWKFVFKI